MQGDISVDPDAVAKTVKRLIEAFDNAKTAAAALPGQDAGGTDDPVAQSLNNSIQELLSKLRSVVDGLQSVVASSAHNVQQTVADFDALDASLTEQLNVMNSDVSSVDSAPVSGVPASAPAESRPPSSGSVVR